MTTKPLPPMPALFLRLKALTPEAAAAHVRECLHNAAAVAAWQTPLMTPAYRMATPFDMVSAVQKEVAEALAYMEAVK